MVNLKVHPTSGGARVSEAIPVVSQGENGSPSQGRLRQEVFEREGGIENGTVGEFSGDKDGESRQNTSP